LSGDEMSGSSTVEEIFRKNAETPAPRPGRGRILIMDDREPIGRMAADILRHYGYEAVWAANGEGAIALYENGIGLEKRFDLVVLDLTIPGGMGARETIRRLREIDPEVRAIATSGYSGDPLLVEFKKHGFKGALSKPFRIEDLAEAVAEILGHGE
jgi:two-component system cell cycle sensor histidine kinase/response regulator CckA